jgi:hypothetical protein
MRCGQTYAIGFFFGKGGRGWREACCQFESAAWQSWARVTIPEREQSSRQANTADDLYRQAGAIQIICNTKLSGPSAYLFNENCVSWRTFLAGESRFMEDFGI